MSYRYECQSCGHRFEEPAWHIERRGDYGFEEVSGCPICGGAYIENDRRCWDCIWRAEDGCTKWDCEYISRSRLSKAIRQGLDLAGLMEEVLHEAH